jgi:hypothetical protein
MPIDMPEKGQPAGETTVKAGTTLNSATIQDASDDDPQDPLEKIIIQRGYPAAGTDVVALKEMANYFKSRESKKTTKAVLMFLISQMPWLIYIVLDKLGGL